ncbi:alanine/ornithine racemase family PLP-dependent enzyme [Yoonia sp.]|uniref:alanine/ornithine racemase family PLP-dependent enzyme n=1 Tax=Yoonia sp. TaxID=2212373 RepID=UPI003976C27E
MTSPRIEVDLRKIRHNTQALVGRLKERGINVTGVTKAVCGHPAIAQAMLDGGCIGLAEARLSNVQRLRKGGIACPITLIRTPMLSQVDEIVQLCEASYNTEIVVIAGLAAAAIRENTVHGIVLMVEMGDAREGILPENLGDVAQQVARMPGVALKGVGANFACLSGMAPTAAQMVVLSSLSNEMETLCGPFNQTVSGGNSANLPWALGKRSRGCINDLRLGEAILLGVDPITGEHIDGMHTDAFVLVAEVIETDARPAPPAIVLVGPALARFQHVSTSEINTRLIFAIGQQDTDIQGLSMPPGSTLIGATSDHLVISMNRSPLRVGAEMRFQMNYKALMHAMAAPDIQTELLHDQPSKWSQKIQSKTDHLTLV